VDVIPGGVRVVSDGDGTRLLTLRMGTGTVSLASELNYDFYRQPEYDTIDATLWYFQAIRDVVDGPGRHEAALRPSQILAVSLPHSPLVPHSSAVVDACGGALLRRTACALWHCRSQHSRESAAVTRRVS
jgi:hypothetical protein